MTLLWSFLATASVVVAVKLIGDYFSNDKQESHTPKNYEVARTPLPTSHKEKRQGATYADTVRSNSGQKRKRRNKKKQFLILDEEEEEDEPIQNNTERMFGEYLCHGCSRFWMSSHSWVDKPQQCKRCDLWVLPHYVTELDKPEGIAEFIDKNKEHPKEKCGKCLELGHYCGSLFFSN